jgi:hypothetical protein
MARREVDYLFDVDARSTHFTEWENLPWSTKRRSYTIKYLDKDMLIIYEYNDNPDHYTICVDNLVTHLNENSDRTNFLVNDLITTNVTQTLKWQDVK